MQVATFYSKDSAESAAMLAFIEGYEKFRNAQYSLPTPDILLGNEPGYLVPNREAIPFMVSEVVSRPTEDPVRTRTTLFTPRGLRVTTPGGTKLVTYWYNKKIWTDYIFHLKTQIELADRITKENP